MSDDPLAAFEAELDHPSTPKEPIYDLLAWEALRPEQRPRGLELLAERARRGDLRAVNTLGAIATPEAVALLRELARHGGRTGSAAEQALLWTREARPEEVARVVRDLRAGLVNPMSAAMSLAASSSPAALPPLLDLLSHPEYLVRYHALEGVLSILDLKSWEEPDQSPLGRLVVEVYSEFPSVYRKAAEELRRLARERLAGRSPEELGLRYRPGPPEKLQAFIDRLPDFDIELLRGWSGHDFEWARAIVVAALERSNPAAAEVIGELGWRDAREALRDARSRSEDPAFIEAVDRALARLG